MSQRRYPMRGMGPPIVGRPTVHPDAPHADDPLRREMSLNKGKFRRLTEPEYVQAYMPRYYNRTINKKIKLDEANNFINPFSLAKIAYMNCAEIEQEEYDKLQTPDLDVQNCCHLLKTGSRNIMIEAMKSKHLECFKRAHKKGLPLHKLSCYLALGHDCLDILKYCHQHHCEFVLDLAFKESAANGYLPCFEYIHKAGGKLTEEIMKTVIMHGSLDCLKYLLQNGFKWTPQMCAFTAISGDLDFVKFCHKIGCPWVVSEAANWYLLAANMAMLATKREHGNLINGMKKCIRYIEKTAEIAKQSKFKNYAGSGLMLLNI